MRILCWAWMTVLLLGCADPSRGELPTPWPVHSPEADPLAGIERIVVPWAWSPRHAVFSAARSRDGRLLAIRRGDHVAFYDAITGVLTARFAVEISPDLRLLSFSPARSLALFHGRGAGLWLFDLATGDQRYRWVADLPKWAGDRFVAFGSYPRRGDIHYIDADEVAPRTVQLIDPRLDECVDRNHCGYLLTDGFHRQPRLIAAPTPPRKVPAIYVVDLERGKVVERIDVSGEVSSLSVSPDDQTIFAVIHSSRRCDLLLLDLATGGRRTLEDVPCRAVHAWHLGTGHLYIAGGGDMAVIEVGPQLRQLARLPVGRHSNARYRGILFDPSSRYGYVTEPYRRKLFIVDTRTLEIVDERPTPYSLSGILVSRAVGVAAEFTAYLPLE